MSNLFIGQIVMGGFNFAPRGTALCNGQIMSIQQNTALFSLVGTFFGGNGTSTFALPNLQGRIPVHQGQGIGLSQYTVGQAGGTSAVALTPSELPVHSHLFNVSANPATTASPNNNIPAQPTAPGASAYAVSQSGYPSLARQAMGSSGVAGDSTPHNNMMPTLFITFVITLTGIFPSRN